MRKWIVSILAIAAIARENPFVLPQPSDASQRSSSVSAKQESQASSASSHQASARTTQKKITQKKALQEVRLKFLKASFYDNHFVIETADPLKRAFTIDKPSKIVLDFGARRAFASKKITLRTPLFKRFEAGAHKNFYRVAVTPAKRCDMRVQKAPGKLTIFCK